MWRTMLGCWRWCWTAGRRRCWRQSWPISRLDGKTDSAGLLVEIVADKAADKCSGDREEEVDGAANIVKALCENDA